MADTENSRTAREAGRHAASLYDAETARTATASTDRTEASPAAPVYAKAPGENNLWMVTCDEGWRESIVCSGMYEWAADWLLGVLGRQPFAPGTRP